jgi:proline dehydrogenase
MKFLYPLAKRFIAGDNFDRAKGKINELMDDGFEVSVDYIGEKNSTIRDCRKAYKQYKEIIKFFKNKKIDISIKPSQLGLDIHPYLCYIFLNNLAKVAKKFKQTIRLDMENSSYTEFTRNAAATLNNKYGNVGVAIQANLRRTDEDLDILIKKGVSVRLVKGAYKENTDIAYAEDHVIESNFFDYAARLYSEKANKPAIATHDEGLLSDIKELIPNADRFYDYEFLYGVRRDLQKSLKDRGCRVRIYVPFGEDWLPYCIRRLKEWKNLKFISKNIFKEWLN